MKKILLILLPLVMVVWSFGPAQADTVKFGIVIEVSGGGAPVGKNWIRGVLMAVDEINQAGGILGKKIETFTLDTQSKPPVSVAAVKKAVDMLHHVHSREGGRHHRVRILPYRG